MARLRASAPEATVQTSPHLLLAEKLHWQQLTSGKSSDDRRALIRDFVIHRKRQAVWGVIIFAAGCAAYLCWAVLLSNPIKLQWLFVFFALMLLTIAKHLILEYRCRKEWFGNNSYEAIQLFRFAMPKRPLTLK